MILSLVSLNGCHDGIDLVDDERFQTVLLVKVCVQELLHCLPILIVLIDASPVVPFLLGENVYDDLLELLERIADLSVHFTLCFAVVYM